MRECLGSSAKAHYVEQRQEKAKQPVSQASRTGKLVLLSVTVVMGRNLVRAHLVVTGFCLTG